MRKDFIHFLGHQFGQFKLKKDGGTWRLAGEFHPLTPLETEVLRHLLEEKGYVVDVKKLCGSRVTAPERIPVNIRKALGSTYVKSESRCEYIETVHGEGLRWIFEPVKSHGFACLEIRDIESPSPTVEMEMSVLKSSFATRVRKELNVTVHKIDRPSETTPRSCFVVEGKCLKVDGRYRLILELTCGKLTDGDKSFERVTPDLYGLLDEATDWLVNALKALIPETVRIEPMAL